MTMNKNSTEIRTNRNIWRMGLFVNTKCCMLLLIDEKKLWIEKSPCPIWLALDFQPTYPQKKEVEKRLKMA